MTDIICPLCGKPNPPDVEECQYCQAPLKAGGFLAQVEGEGQKGSVPLPSEQANEPESHAIEPGSTSSLEQAVPDWLKETEAGFLERSGAEPEEAGAGKGILKEGEVKPEELGPDQISEQLASLLHSAPASQEIKKNAIDDAWLESLLAEAGAGQPASVESMDASTQEPNPESTPEQPVSDLGAEATDEQALPTPPAEKPDWLTSLEASSKIKLESGIFADEQEQMPPTPAEIPEEKAPEPAEQPEWLTRPGIKEPVESPPEAETPIAPAELPGWLEALRPSDTVSPTGPVEDVSGAAVITAGPLSGLRGVISSQPSAIRAQKPPTYSIKLKVTEEQQARLKMMEELLADEEKPRVLPAKSIITSRYIFRLIVALALLLPMIWMIISNSQHAPTPQPGNIPGVVDFTEKIQALPGNATVLLAFDYEAGYSGEMNLAITNVLTQLMKRSAYLILVATNSSGPALAQSLIESASMSVSGDASGYPNYANLGYIPGGTLGLLGLANSPKSILPYTLEGTNVWAGAPLKSISTVKDFAAVIVITNDPDTARMWIEQVGPQLQEAGKPLLMITSAQAEPLIRPYYQANPSQVQGIIGGLSGGIAFARTVGNIQQNGSWDAYSVGITISVLIILIGSIAGVALKMFTVSEKQEP